ncbi:pentatricopeptide repeat-containing protein at1g80880 mitochondrial [Phtheirospermum japonicum]|uniref:Pentatricopeptide repeat-containing protein at1g80880 mitochondrial n=1 Tax=Phtheirospermum japonicum TaxID=374723 RepID=A0A830C3X7_9LAMI|nr:pentatricopeptide repeat-containing protein at1g80880 mitochondrial [Phtheirospermum japonicum]
MISCFSTIGNLFYSLRLYDEMKKQGWTPGADVYHSLIYVITHENCLTEALKIVDRMKETGLKPNATTYNLIVHHLCEDLKFKEARNVLAQMIEDEISPTIDTYHVFMKGESLEGTLGVLDYMRKCGLGPNKDTFLLVLEKFLKLGQHENALKMWSEMKEYEVKLDRSHYGVLVERLAKYRLIEKARKLYSEMRCVLAADDLFLKKQLEGCDGQEVRKGKAKGEMTVVRNIKKGQGL